MYDWITLMTIVIVAAGLGHSFGYNSGYREAEHKYREYLRKKYNDINLFIG